MLTITSTGFQKGYDASGITYKNIFYPVKRGFTVFTISKDDTVSSFLFDTYDLDVTDELIKYLENCLKTDLEYIIGVVDDEAASKFYKNTGIQSLQLGLRKIANFDYRDSYFFLYNNRTKTLVAEELNKHHSIMYRHNPIRIHVVCERKIFRNFEDYTDALRSKIDFDYLLLENVADYDYINSPSEIYMFCQSVHPRLMNKPFRKYLINTEQLTRPTWNLFIRDHLNRNIPVIDYGLENLAVLPTLNTFYVPYQYNEVEISYLRKYYENTPKIYDIAFSGGESDRRYHILNGLRARGFKVHDIKAWGLNRDMEVASCRVLINIHFNDDYNVYESYRCDRWTFAGMPVLSEETVTSDSLDVKKHGLVKFYPFDQLIDGVTEFLRNDNGFKISREAVDAIRQERQSLLIGALEKLQLLSKMVV